MQLSVEQGSVHGIAQAASGQSDVTDFERDSEEFENTGDGAQQKSQDDVADRPGSVMPQSVRELGSPLRP